MTKKSVYVSPDHVVLSKMMRKRMGKKDYEIRRKVYEMTGLEQTMYLANQMETSLRNSIDLPMQDLIQGNDPIGLRPRFLSDLSENVAAHRRQRAAGTSTAGLTKGFFGGQDYSYGTGDFDDRRK